MTKPDRFATGRWKEYAWPVENPSVSSVKTDLLQQPQRNLFGESDKQLVRAARTDEGQPYRESVDLCQRQADLGPAGGAGDAGEAEYALSASPSLTQALAHFRRRGGTGW